MILKYFIIIKKRYLHKMDTTNNFKRPLLLSNNTNRFLTVNQSICSHSISRHLRAQLNNKRKQLRHKSPTKKRFSTFSADPCLKFPKFPNKLTHTQTTTSTHSSHPHLTVLYPPLLNNQQHRSPMPRPPPIRCHPSRPSHPLSTSTCSFCSRTVTFYLRIRR